MNVPPRSRKTRNGRRDSACRCTVGSCPPVRIFFLLLLFLAPYPPAGAAPSFRPKFVSSELDRLAVRIGDTVTLTLTARFDTGFTVLKPPEIRTGPLELRRWNLDTSPTSLTLSVTFQAFTPDTILVPPASLSVRHADTMIAIRSETFPLFVSLGLAPGDSALRDIIGPIAPSPPFWKRRGLLLLLPVLLFLVLILALVWKAVRRRRRTPAGTKRRTPFEEFDDRMRMIKRLLARDAPDIKEIHFVLTEAFKEYLAVAEGIDVLGLSTRETLEHPGLRAWPESLYRKTAEVLRAADLVKFAKAASTREETWSRAQMLREVVEELEAARKRDEAETGGTHR